MHVRQRRQRSIGRIFGKIVAGGCILALLLVASAWVAGQFLATRDTSHMPWDDQPQQTFMFEYTVSTENGYVRVNGTAAFPNGVILVGTLDRVGSGPIAVKEALIMNHRFAMEFGPELSIQYYFHNPQNALQPGVYRLSIEFDPSQQSPFVQESLRRLPFIKGVPTQSNDSREVDAAIIRLAKVFAIGTPGEQQETQAREQQYVETIRQQLHDTLGKLTSFWQRLHVHYQQEHLKGGFSRDDPRANAWQTWSAQWVHDLKNLGEKAQLYAVVSPASPYHTTRETLLNVHKQLALIAGFYFEVLINERAPSDPDLQRAEHIIQYALGDAIAHLGQPDNIPFPVQVTTVTATVVVTSALVNVRNGPGMNHEPIKQLKKDEVLDLLSEQGEWFQVRLDGGQIGWVHRGVVSQRPPGDGLTDDIKRVAMPFPSAERGPPLRLEPTRLLSTPVEFIPHPTSDEVKIYVEVEQQLRNLLADNASHTGERRAVEQRILQRLSEKHGISSEQLWNAYLKVQGWELKP